MCWAERGIKTNLYWQWSCIRHPLLSFQSSYRRIWSISCFIFSWTVVPIYSSIAYVVGGTKNIGSQDLSTSFGQTIAKITSWPFKQFWTGMCWTGRGIKAFPSWSFSCIRHPLLSFQSSYRRIWSISCFIFSWTVVPTYSKIQSFINTNLPSIKPPLTAAVTSGAIVLMMNLIPIKSTEATIVKAIIVLVGTIFATPYVSNRFTSLSMTKLAAGGWGAVNAGTYLAYTIVSNVRSNSSRTRGGW